MSASGQHAPMFSFPDEDGCLQIGGIPLDRLAARIGRTPFYAYDRNLIKTRLTHVRQSLPDALSLHYAVKANPMPALLQLMCPLVDGFDVASAGELAVTLDAGAEPTNISFAGPGKRDSELRAAIAAGIVINIESATEMERIGTFASQSGVRPAVAIRINPDFELKTSGMKMGGGAQQFGIDAERVTDVLRRMQTLDLEFVGFHIFSGSQNLRAEAIRECQAKSIELALRLADEASVPLRKLNLGGGFGIPYFPGDKVLDLRPIADELELLLPRIHERFPEAEVVIELGRYLVGESGIYVCRIVDKKVSRGRVFLITDGGLHHHLAASGNFGQVIRRNYPVAIGNRVGGAPTEVVTIVGPLCTPLDLLADNVELPEAQIGDLVVVYQSGAYGLSASPTAFLGHPPPAEVLV